jgi:hypothetical protein
VALLAAAETSEEQPEAVGQQLASVIIRVITLKYGSGAYLAGSGIARKQIIVHSYMSFLLFIRCFIGKRGQFLKYFKSSLGRRRCILRTAPELLQPLALSAANQMEYVGIKFTLCGGT